MPMHRFVHCVGPSRAGAASKAVHWRFELWDHRWKPEGSFWAMGGPDRLCGKWISLTFFFTLLSLSTFPICAVLMIWWHAYVICGQIGTNDVKHVFRSWGIPTPRDPGALVSSHTPQYRRLMQPCLPAHTRLMEELSSPSELFPGRYVDWLSVPPNEFYIKGE